MSQPVYLNSLSNLRTGSFINAPHSTPILPDPNESGTLESLVKKIFKSELQIRDDFAFECLWKQALINRSIVWKQGQNLDLGTLRAIEDALYASKVFHGDGISVRTHTVENGEMNQFHRVIEYFLGRNDPSMTQKKAYAFFYEETAKNPETMCRSFNQELKRLFLQMGENGFPDPGTPRAKLLEMFI